MAGSNGSDVSYAGSVDPSPHANGIQKIRAAAQPQGRSVPSISLRLGAADPIPASGPSGRDRRLISAPERSHEATEQPSHDTTSDSVTAGATGCRPIISAAVCSIAARTVSFFKCA
jgi:hypothetical protein